MYVFIYVYVIIALGVSVFSNGLRDQHSIQGQITPKTQKTVLDAALLNTQCYKVGIKGKVEHRPHTTV